MINPQGINGVLGKRWCSKRRKRTRKAVVSSSKKKDGYPKEWNDCRFGYCITECIKNAVLRSFVSLPIGFWSPRRGALLLSTALTFPPHQRGNLPSRVRYYCRFRMTKTNWLFFFRQSQDDENGISGAWTEVCGNCNFPSFRLTRRADRDKKTP